MLMRIVCNELNAKNFTNTFNKIGMLLRCRCDQIGLRRATAVGGARLSAAGRLRVAAHGIMKLLMECGAGTQRRSAVGSFGRRRTAQCGTVRRGRRRSAAHGTVRRGHTAAARRSALWRRRTVQSVSHETSCTSQQLASPSQQ